MENQIPTYDELEALELSYHSKARINPKAMSHEAVEAEINELHHLYVMREKASYIVAGRDGGSCYFPYFTKLELNRMHLLKLGLKPSPLLAREARKRLKDKVLAKEGLSMKVAA